MNTKSTLNAPGFSVYSIVDWAEAFIFDRMSRGLSKNTIPYYRRKLNNFVDFCQKNQVKNIEELTSPQIRDYLLTLEKGGHNRGGVFAYYKVLRAFLYWYADENELTGWSNPIRKIKIRIPNNSPLEPADINAIKEIIKTCQNNFTGLRDKAMIYMLLDTGMRASELLSLNIENVNSITGVIQILHGKGDKFRVAYLSKKSRLALRKYLNLRNEREGELFTNRDGMLLTYSGLRLMLKRKCKKAEVEYQSPHSFRRLFALIMLRNGVDIFSLQLLMGHADFQILRRYLKQTNQDTLKAHIKGSPVDSSL